MLLLAFSLGMSGCVFTRPAWSPDGRFLTFLAAADDEAGVFAADWLFGTPPASRADSTPNSSARAEVWLAEPGSGRVARLAASPGHLSPPCWAPDGRSLVFGELLPDDHPLVRPALGPASPAPPETASPVPPAPPGPEVAAPIASGEPTTRGRWTVFRRWADGRVDRLHDQECVWSPRVEQAWGHATAAWSADGQVLVVPDPTVSGLAVLGPPPAPSNEREEGNRLAILVRFDSALLPAFSPDSRQLVWWRRGPEPTLCFADRTDWKLPAREITVPGAEPLQPPVWAKNGDEVYVCRAFPARGRAMANTAEIVAAELGSGKVRRLFGDRMGAPADSIHVNAGTRYFEIDDLASQIFLVSLHPAHRVGLISASLFQSRTGPPEHPLDGATGLAPLLFGGLSLSPDHRLLAFGYGAPEWSAPVAVLDVETRQVAHLIPNEATRMRALWAIAEALKVRLVWETSDEESSAADAAAAAGRFAFDRRESMLARDRRAAALKPTWPLAFFPLPAGTGDRPSTESLAAAAIARLASQGLAILDLRLPEAPATPHPADSTDGGKERAAVAGKALARQKAELRLLFHHARRDYPRALAAARGCRSYLEASEVLADHVLELVIAQCLVGSGRFRQGNQILDRLAHEFAAAEQPRLAERVRRLQAATFSDLPADWIIPDLKPAAENEQDPQP